MQFGDRLRKLRKQKGLTIKELSIQIGISEYHLGNIERNVKMPTVNIAVEIANYFKIGLDDTNTLDENSEYNDIVKEDILTKINKVSDQTHLEFIYDFIIQTKKLVHDVKKV